MMDIIRQSEFCYAQELLNLDLPAEVIDSSAEMFNSEELCEALSNPIVKYSEKTRVVDRLFDKGIAAFLKVVISDGKIDSIRHIFLAYKELVRQKNGEALATLKYATKPSEADIQKMTTMLEKKLGKKVHIDLQPEPSLVGGYRLIVGDTVYDKSIQKNFERLKAMLVRR